MPTASRTFRLFVSSTFTDFSAEREVLHREVFPALDRACRAFGARFRAVDLRWGVSEDAGRDQQTLAICLAEIARCQRTTPRPNFMILFGDRYGWRPLPTLISADDFDRVSTAMTDDDDARLVREWYRRDDNAVPPVWVLRPQPSDGDSATWLALERRLAAALRTASQRTLPPDRARQYGASATEHEIVVGALEASDAAEHVLCLRRRLDDLPEEVGNFRDLDDHGRLDQESAGLLADLERRLRSALGTRLIDIPARWLAGAPGVEHLGALPTTDAECMALLEHRGVRRTICEAAWNGLAPVVLEECAARALRSADDVEIDAHRAFADERTATFVGRQDVLARISAYLDGAASHPTVLVGDPGCGKSAVMARAAADGWTHPRAREVIARFIGATAASTSGVRLLAGVCRQLEELQGAIAPHGDVPPYDEAVNRFTLLLSGWPADKPLVLFVDAIDQLSAADPARNLAWIPHRLPPHVRLVTSTTPGELSAILERKLPPESVIPLGPLPVNESRALVGAWLEASHRQLHGDQRNEVDRAASRCGLPLYLRLTFEEVRRWRSYDGLPAGADNRPGLPDDVAGTLDDLCWRLSLETNHGATLVSHALGYLAAARYGLSDEEVIDVLSRDHEVLQDFLRRSPKSPPVTRLPDVVWSRLFFDVEPYLSEREADGTSTLTFFHREIAELLARRYLDLRTGATRHQQLADYFEVQPLQITSGPAHAWNLRKLSELPFQLAAAGLWDRLVTLLLSFDFLAGKVAAQGPGAAIEDLDRAIAAADRLPTATSEALRLLQATLRLSAHILARDAAQLPAQLHARIARPAPPLLESLVEQAEPPRAPWLKPLDATFLRAGGPVISTIVAHAAAVNGIALSPDGTVGISASSDGTLKVWDLDRETERFVLGMGPTEVLSVALTRDGSTVVGGAADGTIAVWDVASGRLLRSWRGDYSWRALVVSDDGASLLSGSGHQELTIWDLQRGETVKTLRLADSTAAWMAMSGDGRRVLCGGVYDSANVLDLPDGVISHTLYHGDDRWVSGVAISADGRTGVSGDWDGNVWVWNLETGERQFRLLAFRPNERVTAVAISPDGRQVLAASKRGQLNLYDLASAPSPDVEPLARFGTGKHKITHLGITPDGRRAISAGDDATLRVWNLNSREGTGLYADPDPFEDVDDDDEDGRTIRVGGGSARQPIAVGKPDATPLRLDVRLVGAHGPLAQQPAIAPVRKVTQITPRDDDDDPRRIRQKVSAVDFESPRFLDQGRLETAAVSRDGHLLACFGLDRMLTLWDLRNASKGASLQLAAAPREGESLRLHVQSPVLDRSGTRAAALTRDGLCFWRFDTAVAVRRSVKGVMAPLYLTADDSAVAAFCDDGCLRIWRLQDGRQVSRFEVARNASTAFVGVFACWLSPDGHFARVDLGRRKMLRTLTGFGSAAVVWPDGNFALTRPPSGGLAIWHLHREMVLATLPVAGAAGCAVALEPHGGLAAVAGDDLTLWEIPSGRRLDAITGDAPFASCAFDADGVVLTANLQSGREHSFRVERQSTLPEF